MIYILDPAMWEDYEELNTTWHMNIAVFTAVQKEIDIWFEAEVTITLIVSTQPVYL